LDWLIDERLREPPAMLVRITGNPADSITEIPQF
jgi:hypothetical protein